MSAVSSRTACRLRRLVAIALICFFLLVVSPERWPWLLPLAFAPNTCCCTTEDQSSGSSNSSSHSSQSSPSSNMGLCCLGTIGGFFDVQITGCVTHGPNCPGANPADTCPNNYDGLYTCPFVPSG